jgi:hypothetical protein
MHISAEQLRLSDKGRVSWHGRHLQCISVYRAAAPVVQLVGGRTWARMSREVKGSAEYFFGFSTELYTGG